jgi:hypothetical protein
MSQALRAKLRHANAEIERLRALCRACGVDPDQEPEVEFEVENVSSEPEFPYDPPEAA